MPLLAPNPGDATPLTVNIIPPKTALAYIYDHLINAIGSQKLSYFCLLDLLAACDTIDHNILITRLLSGFGIHGYVLSWFKSYLSSRSFRVKCELSYVLSYYLLWCSHGSVLGPLLFIMQSTFLSTLISSLSLDHYLYAGDTQFVFSFYPLHFDLSIPHL